MKAWTATLCFVCRNGGRHLLLEHNVEEEFICMKCGEPDNEEGIFVLDCTHTFHPQCIQSYQKMLCPGCHGVRNAIRDEGPIYHYRFYGAAGAQRPHEDVRVGDRTESATEQQHAEGGGDGTESATEQQHAEGGGDGTEGRPRDAWNFNHRPQDVQAGNKRGIEEMSGENEEEQKPDTKRLKTEEKEKKILHLQSLMILARAVDCVK
ncbi:hypothetical protein AVEN_44895-1 [Araneus ventricosus]|uniref:RING-type domain-containing protein n=1 Tax=Araneus ventricosus TaxID=182803 RepID=A0A4Y2TIW1_ARAVE|nr:hypothetical protein AVEN_44895-1 [Araneus ventricosus]